MSIVLWQVEEDAGLAWKEPVGEVEDFDEDDLNEHGQLDLDQAWKDIGWVLEQVGVAAPWEGEDEELDSTAVQRLASKLKPLSWKALSKKGLELSDEELVRESFELFRSFVVDAARSGSGLGWELD